MHSFLSGKKEKEKRKSGRSAFSFRTRIFLVWLENTRNLKIPWPDKSCLWPEQQQLRAVPSPAGLSFPSTAVWESQRHMARGTVTKRDEEGKRLILLPISLLTFAFSVSDHRVPGINIFKAKSTSTQPQFWQTALLLCGLVCLWPSLSAGQVVSSL